MSDRSVHLSYFGLFILALTVKNLQYKLSLEPLVRDCPSKDHAHLKPSWCLFPHLVRHQSTPCTSTTLQFRLSLHEQ